MQRRQLEIRSGARRDVLESTSSEIAKYAVRQRGAAAYVRFERREMR